VGGIGLACSAGDFSLAAIASALALVPAMTKCGEVGQRRPGSVPVHGILRLLVGVLGGFLQRLLELAVQQRPAVAL
jgi:hypothetical protein